MSEQPAPADGALVPEWTIGDRMRKAREHAGLSQAQLARAASIGRTSIVRYETGISRPSRPALAAWALRTGVSFQWMCHGDTDPCGPQTSRSEAPEDFSAGYSTKMHKLQTGHVA